MVSLNSTVSCGTIPIEARSDDCVTLRISCPSTRILPLETSYSRNSRREMVDLPAPEGPTIATVLPAGTSKLRPFRIGRSAS